MIEYRASMLARMEHELMVESLRPVPEHGSSILPRQPGWVSRQASRLLNVLGSAIQSRGARLGNEHRPVLEAPFQNQLEPQSELKLAKPTTFLGK